MPLVASGDVRSENPLHLWSLILWRMQRGRLQGCRGRRLMEKKLQWSISVAWALAVDPGGQVGIVVEVEIDLMIVGVGVGVEGIATEVETEVEVEKEREMGRIVAVEVAVEEEIDMMIVGVQEEGIVVEGTLPVVVRVLVPMSVVVMIEAETSLPVEMAMTIDEIAVVVLDHDVVAV